MSRALLVVPPLVKYSAGPLLGPAMLAGAARAVGHHVAVADLNIAFIRATGEPLHSDARLTGDHDKPRRALRAVDQGFREQLGLAGDPVGRVDDPIGAVAMPAELVETAAARVLNSHGAWLQRSLEVHDAPDMVGLSLLFGGQVYWALAITHLVKTLWPRVPVVWGGAHVTAIQGSLRELLHKTPNIDGFVVGHAERTFVELLDCIGDRARWPDSVLRPAQREQLVRAEGDATVMPEFDALHMYERARLTLPVQMSRGCSYGKCSFCTYPAIEGRYAPVNLSVFDRQVVRARNLGAALAFKDSLVDGPRLTELGRVIAGRVRWSACTKLSRGLAERLPELAARGCDTLEVGLETVLESSQGAIDKRQSWAVFERVLEASTRVGVALVVNYMTGFPWEDAADCQLGLGKVRAAMHRSGNRGRLEVNAFQLERLAPEVSRGRVRVTRTWPWASVCDWEPVARRGLLLAS